MAEDFALREQIRFIANHFDILANEKRAVLLSPEAKELYKFIYAGYASFAPTLWDYSTVTKLTENPYLRDWALLAASQWLEKLEHIFYKPIFFPNICHPYFPYITSDLPVLVSRTRERILKTLGNKFTADIEAKLNSGLYGKPETQITRLLPTYRDEYAMY